MPETKGIIHGSKPLYPLEGGTAGQKIYRSLMRYSDLPEALIDAHTEDTLSFRTILETTCRLAQSLRRWGIAQNDVISVCSENNLYFVYPVIAALYLGVITAPLNENYTERELFNALKISRPQIIFCSKRSLPKILDLKKKFPFIRKVIILDANKDIEGTECLANFISCYSYSKLEPEDFKPAVFNSDEQVALIMCSSGTTGLPKGVMLTHKNLMIRFAHAREPHTATQTEPTSTVLTFMPFFHAFGLLTTLGYFSLGLRTILLQRFEPELFLRCIQKYQVKSIMLVPPLLVFLAKSPLVDKYDISSLREIGCGAAPLGKETEEAVLRRLNLKGIRQGYGLTEATLALIFTHPNHFKSGSSGTVVPYVSTKVIDPETEKILGPNQRGELCFKTELMMKGYAGDLDATKTAIDEDGWLHSGDIGYYDEEGFFYVVDRVKELIKYKGFQVPPAELEALLLQHPSIRDAAVVGLPDEEAGELPFAFVALQPGKQLTEKEVANFVAGQVSSAKRLRGGVRFVDEVPKSPTGKILRKDLRELLRKQKSKL